MSYESGKTKGENWMLLDSLPNDQRLFHCVPLADFEALADGSGILSFDFIREGVP